MFKKLKNYKIKKNFSVYDTPKIKKNKFNSDLLRSNIFKNLIRKTKKNTNFDKVFFKSIGHVSVAYTKKSRSFYVNNKNVIQKLFEITNPHSRNSHHHQDFKMKLGKNNNVHFTLYKNKNPALIKSQGASHTNYILLDHKIGTTTKHYFIKEVNEYNRTRSFEAGRSGIREAVALDILNQLGINVVPMHFAIHNKKRKQSFIVYDYKNLTTLHDYLLKNGNEVVFKGKKFKYNDFTTLSYFLENEIKTKLKTFKNKYKKEDFSLITDINPENMFVTKSGKLCFFDPWLY